MRMFTVLLLFFTADLGLAQPGRFLTISNYPEWQVTVKVTDEDRRPVAGANVDVGSETNFIQFSIKGLTDTNGILWAHAHGAAVVGCVTEKPGYYTSIGPGQRFGEAIEGRWQPWNPTLEVILKRIVNPIPMYAKLVVSPPPPVMGERVGYDLMAGDWVSPYGKGQNTDMIFFREYSKRSTSDFEYRLAVSFPRPGDGIQTFASQPLNQGSVLRSPHTAPSNGYLPTITRENSRRPGQPMKYDFDETRIYFFRVRTVLDDNGKAISALYGKMYGDFLRFKYYLNPTPNDLNMEFDPKQNLLKNLKDMERVREP